ncbi:MAG: efflux RND transporter permease subunit [Aquiluna sp.]|nr:efflux RND transporter permease subunit [Aquiluna sp.]
MFLLSKLSLANRVVVALVTVIIAAFGVLSLGSLKQELIPSIEIPSAAIVTSYAGASPEVVDKQVSVPIENAVLGLENLESTTVTSTTGLSVIRVSFAFGTTTAQATERLNNALSKVQGSLPQGAEPQVLSGSFDSVPIIVLAVSADNGDNEAIGKQLEQSAPSIFQQVDGVRDVAVSGAITKQVNLTLNQFRLASAGLSQRDISTALTANGLVLPVGTLVDDNGSIAIQMGSAVSTVEAIEALPLVGGSSSSVVTIGDVADVVYEDSPVTSIARTNGKPSLAVSITKTPDANTVAVSNGVQDLVSELEVALGGDVTIVTTLDQAPFIEKSIKDLTTEGLLGLTFAVIVILIFLFSVKSTLITAISIPTSVLITFIGLQTADYSLNILTLGALTIAIGRVVDDSIVVIENINRHLSYGEPRKKAVLTAVREVSSAITASTITTVAVFLPIALVGGLIGELFRPFAFTVAISLLASLLVSLTIVPVLAYWFLRMPKRLVAIKEADPKKFEKKQRHAEEEREKKALLQRGYLPLLNGTRRHPWLTLFASVLILGFTFSLVPQLKTNFIDGAGSSQFIARLEMPASTTFEDQDKASDELEQKILKVEGVSVVQSTVGSAADGRVAFGSAASGISITVQVEEGFEVESIKSEILKLEVPKDADLSISSGAGFGSSETIDIDVASSDNELLQEAVDLISAEMEGVANTSGVTSTLDADERVLEIVVDREKAAKLGFSETQVTGIVAAQLRPSPLGRVSIEGEDVSVYVAGTDLPESISEIKALVIPSFTGLVRLDSIASVEEVLKPTSITSKEGNRTAKVSVAPEGDDLGAITVDITAKLDSIELPAGVTATIGGAAADQAESFEQLGLALLAAIAIVYVVMVATFGSLIQPLLLLVSIPFAATGALGLLLLTDTPLGVPALIGMLMLIGIVVTNAIVLIDLVNQYRKQGRSVEDSLISGARQRLRPILMTALATIFALTPMAIGLTGDSGFISQPLAIVVIGGLFSSTLLTLLLVPTLYWLVEGRKERKALRVKRRAARAAKKAEKKQAKASVKTLTPAPVAVETPKQQPSAITEVATEEISEDALTDAIAETFAPAQPAETPNLSWSITQDEVELDSEATMQWNEAKTETAPIAAIQNTDESLDFLTSENPIVSEPSKQDLKAQRRAEKADQKAQKKAAKNSRHSGD